MYLCIRGPVPYSDRSKPLIPRSEALAHGRSGRVKVSNSGVTDLRAWRLQGRDFAEEAIESTPEG